ncbi:EamA family transporter [Halorientalis marina]|uniref:EamA family transporter n=1 Tax=Halorientalis marina TaxID=2931976 RepID=UPI001FF51E2D|nr:EamA family transporter [Halorientalis marina]
MNYLLWALGAMVSYSFVFLFVKLAQRELPIFTVMSIAIFVLMATTTVVTVATGEWDPSPHAGVHTLYALAAGFGLAGAVVGYFRALSLGPVSSVVPIYGLFIVGGSVLGIVVLNEPLTARKGLGIAFAVCSVFLIAT